MPRSKEQIVGVLAILVFCGLAMYRLILWVKESPLTADPWGKEIDEALDEEEAIPLCHHCLTPQTHNGWFCPQCGATVGPYCYYLPYVYIFAQGEVLRAGVTERFRRSWLLVFGFVLFSFSMFSFAAPVYWFFLFKNLLRSRRVRSESEPASL